MTEFKNRTCNNINRKRYVIEDIKKDLSGEITEIIATENRYDHIDECDDYTEGTELTAENLNEIINNMIEDKINETLLNLEDNFIQAINEFTIDNIYVNELNLPNMINENIKVSWECDSNKAQIINNKLIIERTSTNQIVYLKAYFSWLYLNYEKKYEITVKGTSNSIITGSPNKTIEWIQGTSNFFEEVLTTNDSSKLLFNIEEIQQANNDVMELFDVRVTDMSDSEIGVVILEKYELKEENKVGVEIFNFVIKFYIDNILEENSRTLNVCIEYNYSSNDPED